MQIKAQPLTTAESLALDIIRTLAAVVVAVGHLTQPYFSTRWPDLTYLAVDSVAVFFVLSGFVIRYVTRRQPGTFPRYLGDRASRIYSVAIPALLLTLVCDSISKHVNPGFYSNWILDFRHPLRRILLNLLFCGQIWKFLRDPLSNSPFWSINYEVAYYILYGCFFYLWGSRRWIALILVGLFFGPWILYLAPLWIAGCWLCDAHTAWNSSGKMLRNLLILTLTTSVIFALIFLLQSHWQLAQHLPGNVLSFAERAHIKPRSYRFGIVWVVVFLWILWLARHVSLAKDSRTAKAIRFIAEGTYPLYLIHFPLFVLVAACVPYNHGSVTIKITIFLCVFVLSVLAGHPANILKQKLRALHLPSFFRTSTLSVPGSTSNEL